MNPQNKKQLSALRGAIKGLAYSGQEIRTRNIATSKGEQKYEAWALKRSIGHVARCHLLAYGLSRGQTREQVEKSGKRKKLIYLDSYFTADRTYIYGFNAKKYVQDILYILSVYKILPYDCDQRAIEKWLADGNKKLISFEDRETRKLYKLKDASMSWLR